MPRYPYRCKDCEDFFEVEKPMSAATNKEVCPLCQSENTTRVFFPVPITYHSDGFYHTDYHKNNQYPGTKQDLLRHQYETIAGEKAPDPAIVPRSRGEKF